MTASKTPVPVPDRPNCLRRAHFELDKDRGIRYVTIVMRVAGRLRFELLGILRIENSGVSSTA